MSETKHTPLHKLTEVEMEAMAKELPVISTHITGIPELIQDNMNGLLIPPRNPILLAETIEKIMINRAFAKKLGKEGRKTIMKDFNIITNVNRLVQVLQK